MQVTKNLSYKVTLTWNDLHSFLTAAQSLYWCQRLIVMSSQYLHKSRLDSVNVEIVNGLVVSSLEGENLGLLQMFLYTMVGNTWLELKTGDIKDGQHDDCQKCSSWELCCSSFLSQSNTKLEQRVMKVVTMSTPAVQYLSWCPIEVGINVLQGCLPENILTFSTNNFTSGWRQTCPMCLGSETAF